MMESNAIINHVFVYMWEGTVIYKFRKRGRP